jgi:hypothetical protein
MKDEEFKYDYEDGEYVPLDSDDHLFVDDDEDDDLGEDEDLDDEADEPAEEEVNQSVEAISAVRNLAMVVGSTVKANMNVMPHTIYFKVQHDGEEVSIYIDLDRKEFDDKDADDEVE